MSKSDSRKVVLHPVSWKTSGLFRCEVSAEAPSFASAQSEARMEVVCKSRNIIVIIRIFSSLLNNNFMHTHTRMCWTEKLELGIKTCKGNSCYIRVIRMTQLLLVIRAHGVSNSSYSILYGENSRLDWKLIFRKYSIVGIVLSNARAFDVSLWTFFNFSGVLCAF